MIDKKRSILVFVVLLSFLSMPVSADQVPRNFLDEVAKGNIVGHEVIHKHAFNPSVGGTWEILWENGTNYVFPLVAVAMSVSSDNVADDAVIGPGNGAGAWNVTVIGLDGNWVEQNDTVQLDGLNPVLTTLKYLRINFFYVVEANATGTNDNTNTGNIYLGTGAVAAGVPANVYDVIGVSGNIGHGRALAGFYSVPCNHTAFILSVFYSSEEDKDAHFGLRVRNYEQAWHVREYHVVYRDVIVITPHVPMVHEAMSDITIVAYTGVAPAEVTGGICMLIVENEYLNLSNLPWADGTYSTMQTKDPTVIWAVGMGILAVGALVVALSRRR